jgi:hypothetical protein
MASTSSEKWASVDRRLWFGFLLGPAAAGINTIVGYTVSHYACAQNHKLTLYIVTAVDLLLCLGGIMLATSARSALAEGSDKPVHHERRSFLLAMAIGMCLFAALLTVAGTLAVAILHPCD